MSRSPSPRGEADRRGRYQPEWDEEPDPRWADEDEDDGGVQHTLVGRRMFWILILGLVLLTALVIGGILLVSNREDKPIDTPGAGEEIPVLKSPGPWKEAPSGADAGGVPVEGQGQVMFGTGDGRDPGGRIALEALPEDPILPQTQDEPVEDTGPMQAPVPAPAAPPKVPPRNLLPPSVSDQQQAPAPKPAPPPKPAPKPAPKPVDVVTPRVVQPAPAPTPKTEAPKPAPAPASGSGSGSHVQLGAFSSEARARTAWKALSGRFSYLAGHEPQIVPAARDGKTLYRLRIAPGSTAAARDLCGRLKVAGEACTLVD